EATLFVLVGTTPNPNAGLPTVDLGGYLGLYRSTNNGNNFTKVMMKSSRPVPNNIYRFRDIAIGNGESAYAAALIVDKNNPAIVTVGSAFRYFQHQGFQGEFSMNHDLLRVDTSNMIESGT